MDASTPIPSLQQFLILAQANQAEMGSGEASPTVTNDSGGYENLLIGLLVVFGIFVLPFILGHLIAKAVKMRDHSFRIGIMLAAIFGAAIFGWLNDFKLPLGFDMKGGTTLIYDITENEEGQKLDAGDLASALSQRINPSGTKEISIRPRGESQIEIIVPMTNKLELDEIKRRLQNSGQLEFRIVANTRDHLELKSLAERQASTNSVPKKEVLNDAGEVVGLWYQVGRKEDQTQGVLPLQTPVLGDVIRDHQTGKIIEPPQLDMNTDYAFEKWLKTQNVENIDVLMSLTDRTGSEYAVVAGDDLASAATEFDQMGQPTVAFTLTPTGARKMGRLTSANQPIGEFKRRMAIIMDGLVLSAPTLNSPISSSGQITGNFTIQEVKFLVTILRSGRLPATLSDEPVSEEQVGAGLGATTISKGTTASIWAVVTTFLCILLYYRFSGAVAALALLINGLLIFGIMIFIKQPLTLPGLAGLVLTVGMSVDANVLIFERIREERNKRAAPRMAIRNGFDKAFTTIIDSNLTTLIAAIVLYWIGTDQVRGFAVALVIGIATSMFTATFCSRIVFEIAEKLRIANLSMADGVGLVLGNREVNFMGWQKACFALSLGLILAGVAAVIARGTDILNIDFTGGSSVTLQTEEAIEADEMRTLITDIFEVEDGEKPIESSIVLIEKPPANTAYTVVTSIDDEKLLSKRLSEGFEASDKADLVKLKVKITQASPSNSDTSMIEAKPAAGRLVSFQEEGTTESQPAAPATPQEPEAEAEATTEPAAEGDDAETPAAESPANDSEIATAVPSGPVVFTEYNMLFSGSSENGDDSNADNKSGIPGRSLLRMIETSAESANVPINLALVDVQPDPMPTGWNLDDVKSYDNWKVRLPLAEAEGKKVTDAVEAAVAAEPKWLALSKIGGRVAGEMQQRAIAAILLSLVFIVAYIWFRFQKISYGLAAVVALVHDILITLGVVALCHWLAGPLSFLLIEDFKIGLTEVAAFLTIIGYSLNDTIVVFDRIREVRGRSPRLDAEMVNKSVNQTLSRTLLTSGTTLLTVALLYVFGGEGIHTFAFALLIGVMVGTYSSIFVAAPVLLWISNREASKSGKPSITS